jgi:hypothetical protein
MFQEGKKKLEAFESAEGKSATAPTPQARPGKSVVEVTADEFTISGNSNHLVDFPVHTKFSRSGFDRTLAPHNYPSPKLGQEWSGGWRREVEPQAQQTPPSKLTARTRAIGRRAQ